MNDILYLKRALKLAEESKEPTGCGAVLVMNGAVITEAYNSQRQENRAIQHAEVKIVDQANKITGRRVLIGSTAYCSCEPCAMCLTALSYANVERIVYTKTMKELFPDDPQANMDSQKFVSRLNFVPKLEQLIV